MKIGVKVLNESDEEFLRNMLNEAARNDAVAIEGLEIVDMAVKLNGVALRKAEFDGNFSRVYSKIFERMVEVEALGNSDLLNILGEKGG